MIALIEYCANNQPRITKEVIRRLEQETDFDIMEYGCLGNCGICFGHPYVLVNGKVVHGATADELYGAIMKAVEAEQADPFADLDLD